MFVAMEEYTIIRRLRDVFGTQCRMERFKITMVTLEKRLEKWKLVRHHVLEMIDHFKDMEWMGSPMSVDMAVDLILNSLDERFQDVVTNFEDKFGQVSFESLLTILEVAERKISAPETVEEILSVQETVNTGTQDVRRRKQSGKRMGKKVP